MSNILKPLIKEEFNILSKIKFNNINEGFENYTSGILSVEESKDGEDFKDYNLKYESKFINFVKEAFILNNRKPILIDFYLKDLESESILKILDLLDYDDKLIFIDNLKALKEDTIYFLVEEEGLIPFLTRLSTREIFFITMYFTGVPLALWGNYNLSFPMFFKGERDLNLYLNIAKNNRLLIRDISYK